jgi:hypothetical protein
LNVLSFLYAGRSHFGQFPLEEHNTVNNLHRALPRLRAAVQRFAALHPVFLTSCPFSFRLRLVRQDEAQSYGCSAETLGGTGREGVHNLLRDGNFGWNKWFDPTVYAGTQYAYAQVNPARPVRLVGYGVKSANDVPARDPKDWHLEIANNFIPVHSVANEHFPNRYETHWFSLTVNEEGMPQPTRMIRIVVTDTLRRRMEGARIPGTQVGQLYFLVVDEE